MTDIRELLTKHYAMMLRYAQKLSNNETNADDIVQQACVYALQSKSPPEHSYERRWLATCVWNAWSNFVRLGRRLIADGDETARNVAVDGGQFAAARLGDVRRIVSGMSVPQAKCFYAVSVMGMETREAAKVLGFKQHVSVSRYNRQALAALAAA